MKKISVQKSTDLGLLFYDNPVHMIGQDAAYSILIDDEKALWIFGDTLIGKIDPESNRREIDDMPTNTGLICPTQEPTVGLKEFTYLTNENGRLKELVRFLEDESPKDYRVWAMHGCHLEGKVYLYYVKVRLQPEKDWPYKFSISGSGLAVADFPELNFTRVKHQNTTHLWAGDEPCFGVAVLPDHRERLVYVYGTRLENKIHRCYLARVPFEHITDITRYEYLISPKPEWSRDSTGMIPILRGMPTEMTVSFNNHLGCYLAVYSRDKTSNIEACTAPNPWGPWSEPTVLHTAKAGLRNPLVYGGPTVYAGKEHPELARENGKIIYLTFIEFEEYFPHLVEVVLG
ncbi:DUF4185 domain-containing protein [candidate division KSB1 bacterium]|nr:DUF4185 domain-containing protein [candidate division KSB1 bacterium]